MSAVVSSPLVRKYLTWLLVIDSCRLLDAVGLTRAACWVGEVSGLHDSYELLWYEIDRRGQQQSWQDYARQRGP